MEKKTLKWLCQLILLFYCASVVVSCSDDDSPAPKTPQKSIVILYENDVHCSVEGYARIAGLRNAIAASDTAYAGIVSSGDFLSGGLAGAASMGRYIIDIMRNVGYDALTLGNHEFDFGTTWMVNLFKKFNAPVVCANFFEYGASDPVYAPYVIKRYGQKRVAFVGVCTPETMRSESYSIFDVEGNQNYDFRTNEVNELVQRAVDNARGEGADYVVLLAHLGDEEIEEGVYSNSVVAATRGIDVVLDAHSHHSVPHNYLKNSEGKTVIVTQTGTQFENVGKLVITKDGNLTTELIPMKDIGYVSDFVVHTTDSVNALLAGLKARKVAISEYDLEVNGPDGKRLIRSGETNLGDLIADAFRAYKFADIGLQNGGGVRTSFKAGEISYGDIFDVLPFGNTIYKIEAKGKQILDMLQKCTAKVPEEDGNFPQVAGIRFIVHTVSHTVSDVYVQDFETGVYQPIDEEKTYTIALNSFFIGGGFYDTLKTAKILENSGELDRDVVVFYMEKKMSGTIATAYSQPQGRITMVND